MAHPPAPTAAHRAPAAPRPAARHQRGISLLVVLLVLTAMLVGAVALMRSTQISSAISGNLAARDQGLAATDWGVYAAVGRIMDPAVLADPDAPQPPWYSPVERVNAAGVPAPDGLPPREVWEQARPGVNEEQVGNHFTVQYFVERLCSSTPVTDPSAQCMLFSAPAAGSNRIGAAQLPGRAATFYRITVRAVDARGTEVIVQSVASR